MQGGRNGFSTTWLAPVAAQLLASSGSIRHRGIAALTTVLGLEDVKAFLEEVRETKDLDDLFK